jgi:hypothetical protein
MGGGVSALLSIERFIPNDAIPGQTRAVLEVAESLAITTRDLNKLYSSFLRLHTEGVVFKIVNSYLLMAIGANPTPFTHGLFKVSRSC